MTGKWHTAHTQAWIFLSAATMLAACSFTPPWDNNPPPTTIGTRPATGGAASNGVPAGFYRANPGDTLQSIAGAFGQRPQDIATWNGMNLGTYVTPGQVLRVAPPSLTPGGTAVPSVGAPQTPSSAAAQPGVLAWPLRGPILKNFVPGKTNGIVIGGRVGDPVKAAAAGRVVYAGTGIPAYGPLVIIKHSDSLITAYGQNSKLLVQEGDAVTQGQPIAEVGKDSNGVGSIQFEVREDGHPADPLAWLPR
jgi:lipoprotein NlpD